MINWSRGRLTYSGGKTTGKECVWYSPACLPAERTAGLFADAYSPAANTAAGYSTAIAAMRARFEAEREKRPGLTAEQFAREQGSSYLGRSE